MSEQIIWKKSDELKHYKIFCFDYLRSLFQKIIDSKNGPNEYVFYYDPPNDVEAFELVHRYFIDGEKIDIQDFEKDKSFCRLPLSSYEPRYFDNTLERNKFFTITDMEEINDDVMVECGDCHKKFPGGFCFNGIAYNHQKYPVKYEGYFKTLDWFFSCDCEDSRRDVTEYQRPKTLEGPDFGPCVEFRLDWYGETDSRGLCDYQFVLRVCSLFAFKYTKLSNIVYKSPSLKYYVGIILNLIYEKSQSSFCVARDYPLFR